MKKIYKYRQTSDAVNWILVKMEAICEIFVTGIKFNLRQDFT